MRKHKVKPFLTIGYRATSLEQEHCKLVMRERKFSSFSHTLRVLVDEAAEKILSSKSTVSDADK